MKPTQTRLYYFDFASLRKEYGKIDDAKKMSDKEVIRHQKCVIAGLRGEITKIKKHGK